MSSNAFSAGAFPFLRGVGGVRMAIRSAVQEVQAFWKGSPWKALLVPVLA